MTMLDRFRVHTGLSDYVILSCDRCKNNEDYGEVARYNTWSYDYWLQEIVEDANRHLEEKHPVDYQKILEGAIVAAVITKETSEA